MPHPRTRGPASARAWVAIAMAWCAAFVDAVGYLDLRRLFTAHMTGNTASFGLQGAAGEAAGAWQAG